MKKILYIVSFLFFLVGSVIAQDASKTAAHRIVFQLQSADTMSHKALMKQLNNILTVAPGSKVEVVCHGPGLDVLIAAKSVVAEKVKQLTEKGVSFVACEFSMADKQITKEQLIPAAGTVKYGIIEIVTRQEEGWSYLKAGF